MSRGFSRIVGSLMVLGIVGLWVLFRPTESRRITRTLEGLAKEASFRPGEGQLRRLARVETLVNAFTEDAVIRFETLGIPPAQLSGRDEIRSLAGAIQNLSGGMDIQLFDPVVTLGPAEDTARVNLTASGASGKQEAFTAQEFEFRLVRRDGTWRIRELNTVKTLRR